MTKKKTRLLTVGLAMIVLLAAALFAIPRLNTTASAQAWSGNVADDFAGGSGTSDDPYQIANGEQLAYLAQQVNDGNAYSGVYFELTADIDLGGKDGREWTPISYGGYDKNDNRLKTTDFAGIFNGKGHTISDLKIGENGASKHTGLFGYSSGTIRNLYLDNVNIDSWNGIGAICDNNSGTIEACGVNSGTLKTAGSNGGNIGGICENNYGIISKCYNMADIAGGSENGGICAVNDSVATLKNCYNGGSIDAVGGISNGGISAKNSGTISSCLNFGRLGSANGVAYYGICGNGTGTMENCYNDSDVSDVLVSGFGGTQTNVQNKTTAELCSESLSGFENGIWTAGTKAADPDPAYPDDPRFQMESYVYPGLDGIDKEVHKSAPVQVYAFGKTTADDLCTYTLISSKEEFLAIGNDPSKWDTNYVLTTDIDLKGEEISPIGSSKENLFKGNFSGGGHTISNVVINRPEESYIGLFGVSEGTITLLYVENAQIVAKGNVGGICGWNRGGTIRYCGFSGTVQGSTTSSGSVGGIVGYCYGTRYGNTTVENCFSAGVISGFSSVGGVCGYSDVVTGCISACEVSGTASGIGSGPGAVCGNNGNQLKVNNCYYDKDVCSLDGVGSGTSDVTGLTTQELCQNLPAGLDSSVWKAGSYTVKTEDRLRTTTMVYPSLIGVDKAYTAVKYEYDFNNDGTYLDCTLITTADEFAAIGNDETKWLGNYVLGEDMDLEGRTDITPIGGSKTAFTGKFSGNGHTISNVEIKKSTENLVGLFGRNGGLIADLHVENANVVGYSYVGGICGDNNDTISGCTVSGNVRGDSYVGGICGRNYGTISRCAFSGEVKANLDVGGICGGNLLTIKNCYSIGKVSGNTMVGGVCGLTSGESSTIDGCYSAGKITGNLNSAFGGIAGQNNNGETKITNCYYDNNASNNSAIGASDGSSSDDEDNNVKGLTMAELCSGTLPTGFGSDWKAGETTYETSGLYRTATYTYPSLDGVSEPYSVEREEYNFGIEGKDDWQEYIKISTADEFVDIGNDRGSWNNNYVLTANIDLNGRTDVSPIGRNFGNDPVYFTGRFSGNGFTISNVNINRPYTSTDLSQNSYTGIFGCNNGVIINLGVEGSISGYYYVGGICGSNEADGVVYGCSFAGTINAQQYAGGICGSNNQYNTTGDGKISNCYAIADVSAHANAGGVCGRNSSLVEYCYSSGAVTVPYGYVYDPVCFNELGTSNYCYYNSELCGSGHLYDGGVTTNIGVTAQELCTNLPNGFSDSVWEAGSYTVGQADGKLREDSYTYPSFNGRKTYSVKNEKRYDFGIDGNHDWQIYTLITTAKEFAAIGEDQANWLKNYVLGGDIDLGGETFVPIGTDLVNYTGRFSGDGYSFKNVSTPLFDVNNGIIEYLTIGSGSIKYNGSTGSICRDNKGTVYCCGNNADVEAAESTEGTNNAGGIAANNMGGLISNCYNAGSVTAPGNAGGICVQNTGTIEYCYNVGLVSGAQADAVCYEQKGTSSNCYYDEMCGSSENGLGSTTWNMTYGTLGNLDKTIWVKKPNTIDSKTGEGVAYYPSFSERFAPSVGFTVTQKFSVLGDEPLVYGDDIVFSANETMEFDTGFSMTNSLSAAYVEMDGKSIANGFSLGRATWKADTVGETTFTLVHEYSYYNGAMTKDITVNIEKAELTVADFDFVPAADLVFNNKEKAVKITAKQGMEGVGAVTVKYFSGSEELDSVPVNAGDYTVKISVEEGDFYKAAELEDSAWAFTIEKAAAPGIPKIELSCNWKTDEDVTILVPGIPENLGEMIGYTTAPAEFNGKAPVYSDGRFSFHIGPYSEDKVDTTVEVSATISSQNYNDFDFVVEITLNNKANKEAPDPGDFDIVFTDNGNGITAEIATALEGVEYSFDGAYWSSENTLDVAHDEDVTAYIRYAQTDDMNYSAPVSRRKNSGHGTMVHHDRVDPDCTRTGTAEYWECEQCARYFLDEDCKTETTLEDVVLAITDHTEAPAVRENEVAAACTTDGSYDEVVYCAVCSTELSRKRMTIPAEGHKWAERYESDKTGHWHKCEVCSADSAVEAHVSGGAATEDTPETCTACGYVIAPELGHIHANHLSEVPAKAATCTEDGNTAYFLCSCGKLFSDSAAGTEVTAADVTIRAAGHKWAEKYESDKTGHWHKCEICSADSAVEAHVSGGAATVSRAETCTVCGYEIAPKKTSGGSSTGGSSGVSSRPSGNTDTRPAINGVQKSWTDIAADLEKQNGGSAVIDLNGKTTVPADVIRAIANGRIKAELVVDSVKSWIIDGSKIIAAAAADLSSLPGNADRSALRGISGADLKVTGTGVPAELKLKFRKEFAGQFANVYKLTDKGLVFQGCVKVGEDGSAVISGANAAGEYVVMVCEFSDLSGDLNNDGALNALDASAILRDIVGILKGANPLMGDFNGDGIMNALDASAVLKRVVGAA